MNLARFWRAAARACLGHRRKQRASVARSPTPWPVLPMERRGHVLQRVKAWLHPMTRARVVRVRRRRCAHARQAFATAKRWQQNINGSYAKSSPITGHSPIPKTLTSSRRGVLLLRNPLHRLRSAHKFYHAVGMNATQRVRLQQEARTVKEYAEFPGIAGCQTKMLSGRNCASPQTLTPDDLRAAKRVLRRGYSFVGLTEFYNESVCLFHAQHGGEVSPYSFFNSRPSSEAPRPNGDVSHLVSCPRSVAAMRRSCGGRCPVGRASVSAPALKLSVFV